MASRFELILHGEDAPWLRAAGEEALSEIRRLEHQLSRYRPTSDIGRINARAADEPVRVESRLFRLLQHCRQLYTVTSGAFDITVAPLMNAWGFTHSTGQLPAEDRLTRAREHCGMHLVELDEREHSVTFSRPGVTIDLGAIGKGYAVDEAMLLLREAGVESAFLHGGTSTIYGLGSPPDSDAWRVAVPRSAQELHGEESPVALAELCNASLSVSAVWGKSFVADGVVYGHVLDPRLGRPVEGADLAAVTSRSATTADALSTALLVLGADARDVVSDYGDVGALVVERPSGAKQRMSAAPHMIRMASGLTIV
ncbi:MAG: FAD:protein FMN transferase [Bacteroidota bacterium]